MGDIRLARPTAADWWRVSTPVDALILPNLPQDVIREIIKVGQESIYGMQLISHAWNVFVTDHLKHRRNLPVIEKLCWEREESTGGIWRRPPKKGEDAYWRLVITIDKRYQRYFGLDSWSQSDSDGVECDYIAEYSKLFKRSNAVKMSICERLTHLCKRISHIEKIHLDKHLHEKCIFLKNAISDMPVKQLSIGPIGLFEKERAAMILDLVRANSLQHLQLKFPGISWGTDGQDLSTLLCEASRTVPKITLRISDLRLLFSQRAILEAAWEKRMKDIFGLENVLITVVCKHWHSGHVRICMVKK
ncbi:hypothetical protein PRIPAC_85970 [Pristionchus pacificus]|nr:hypothetical protein PRIPAC_85970 [Pristionchus pacificus]